MRTSSRRIAPTDSAWSWLRRDPRWAPVLAFASAPLWLGGATATAHLVVTTAALLGLVGAAWLTWEETRVPPSALWWLVGAAVFTGIQLVPLPLGLVEWVAPDAVAQAEASSRLTAIEPRFVPISRDPGRTLVSFATACLIVGTAFATSMLVHRGRRIVLRVVVSVSVAIAFIALFHGAVGAERFFGVYSPRHADPVLLGPLLNDNHLAAVLAAAVPLALELGFRAEERRFRVLAHGAALLCAATAVGTLSRSAIPTIAIGVMVQALALRSRRGRGVRKTTLVAIGICVLGAALALYVGTDRVMTALGDSDVSKLETMHQSLFILGDSPWVGVGRGAFTVAFAQQHGMQWRYEQPENWPLLWGIEWGFILGPLLAVALAKALLNALRSSSRSAIACVAALVSLAAHDLVDFSLEMPGIAVLAAMLFATAVTSRRSAEVSGRKRWLVWGPVVVAFLVGTTSLFWRRGVDVQQQEDALRAGLHHDEDITTALTRALAFHPSEPNFVLFGAAHYVRNDSDRAPTWLNRVMVLAPNWPQPHVLAARYLARRGHLSQARLEVREAAALDPGEASDVACWVVRLGPHTVDAVLQVVPSGEHEVEALGIVARCVDDDIVDELDRRILALDPTFPGAVRRESERLRRAGRTDEAIATVRAAFEREPHDALASRLVELLVATEQYDAANTAIDRLAERSGGNTRTAALRASVAQSRGDLEGMRDQIERMRAYSAGSVPRLAESYRLLGTLERRAGNHSRSLDAYEHAYRLTGSARDLREVARAADAADNRRRAGSARRLLCSMSPDDC